MVDCHPGGPGLTAEDVKAGMYKIWMVYLFVVEDERYRNEIEVDEVEIVVAYGASAKAALLLITANCLCDPSHESITQPPKVDIAHRRGNFHWMNLSHGKKTSDLCFHRQKGLGRSHAEHRILSSAYYRSFTSG